VKTTLDGRLSPPAEGALGADTAGRIGPDGEGLVVAHEQVAEFGGMERVAETLFARYPAASLVACRFRPPPGFSGDEAIERLADRIRAGRSGNGGGAALSDPRARVTLVEVGGRRRHYLAPFYAFRIGSADIDDASVVLSTGGMAWTLAVAAPPGALHVGYIGGRPRAFYEHRDHYLRDYPLPVRAALTAALPGLRAHHRRLLRRPDRLAANSIASARSLEPLAGRPVEVIYPPVRTDVFTPDERERRHFRVVARARWHKRTDLIVEAFRRVREPLVVVGGGPELDVLRSSAPPNVSFTGHVDHDHELRDLYRSSRALISASIEEFGLCVAEAQAAGVPAIAPREGGASEIVREGGTGLLLDRIDADSIADAVRRIQCEDFDPKACRAAGERFSEARFLSGMAALIEGRTTPDSAANVLTEA
jgi:glycosyltransferase involved in cell wall biosynthesis